MMRYDLDDLIALNMAGIGYIRMKALTDHFGELNKALEAGIDELRHVKDIGSHLARKVAEIKKGRKALDKEWSLVKKHKVKILSIFDKDYPENLRNIYDPPILLYIKGDIMVSDKMAIALVGSRKASLYGINICRDLASQLSRMGLTIVSGLARGIDSAAHKGAIDGRGRTIGVLGSGLDNIYPPENEKLASEIASSGALISEFPMEMPPLPRNFPIRNRIISGLSLGVIVVEAAKRSGALITADLALEQGREVFAVPGRAGSLTSTGAHRLIKQGAKLVDKIDDITEELNIDFEAFIEKNKKSVPDKELAGKEKKVYAALSEDPLHIDSIKDKTDLSAEEIATLLLKLEIKRMIRQLPGRNFITIN